MLQYLSVYRSWFQSHGSAHKLVNFEIIIIIFVSQILLNTIISHGKNKYISWKFPFYYIGENDHFKKTCWTKILFNLENS